MMGDAWKNFVDNIKDKLNKMTKNPPQTIFVYHDYHNHLYRRLRLIMRILHCYPVGLSFVTKRFCGIHFKELNSWIEIVLETGFQIFKLILSKQLLLPSVRGSALIKFQIVWNCLSVHQVILFY